MIRINTAASFDFKISIFITQLLLLWQRLGLMTTLIEEELELWKDFLSGVIGGVSGLVAGQPFDVIKCKLQATSMTFKETYSSIKKPFGFFSGMASPMCGVAAINAVLFTVYGGMTGPTLWDVYFAGCAAGFTQSVIAVPIELTKIQSQIHGNGSIYHFRRIFREKGIKGLYRGSLATVLRDTPSYGIYFAVYEGLCSENPTSAEMLMNGGLAGIFGWIFTYPIDVAKTVIQSSENHTFKSIWNLNHPTRWYFRGLTATLLRAIPTNALTFFAYSHSMKLLENI
eukprot:NODE_134_length_16603_cov_0.784052.p7 type:complete len:284 gc:universal NODE_134_length_16603_cov_0.784052:10854-11705(+)